MSNIPEKRPSEQPDEAEAKKPHIEPRHDHFAKGIAPIKAEFIVENPDVPVEEKYINDDEAEGGDRQEEEGGKGGKNKKRRGQNKKRDLKQQHEEVRLCSSLLDPENPKECRFGAENCRNSHNVEEYISSKPEDIEGNCPVYTAIGYCPAGLKCRWLHSHYNKETHKLLKDLEQVENAKSFE